MKLFAKVERVYRERPVLGWILTFAGMVLPVIGTLGLYFLHALADFSSHVRDDYETPPGAIAYSLFAFAIALCAAFIGAGLLLTWTRMRRNFAAWPHDSNPRGRC